MSNRAAYPPLDIRHLVIDTDAKTPLQANGISIVARRIAEEQFYAGHPVTLTYLSTIPRSEAVEPTIVPARVLRMIGTKVGGRIVQLAPQVTETLAADATGNTIFHIHGRDTLFLSLTAEFRRRGLPYALTIHGRYSHMFDQDNRVIKWLPALYASLIERHVLEGARFVQAVTPAEQKIVQRIAPRAICELIYNAAYSSRTEKIPQAPTRKFLASSFPVFGFCGRYAIEHKGLDLLLEGFAEYRKAGGNGSLRMIGTGSAREPLKAMAESLSVGHLCQIDGPLFGEDKKQVLLTWDFFVMPSRFEGLPTGGLEAAMLGLPLIASQSTGLHEHIARFRSGFPIERLKPQSIANALLEAEQLSADDWSRMSNSAFRMALPFGDWTAVAALLVDLYRR